MILQASPKCWTLFSSSTCWS